MSSPLASSTSSTYSTSSDASWSSTAWADSASSSAGTQNSSSLGATEEALETRPAHTTHKLLLGHLDYLALTPEVDSSIPLIGKWWLLILAYISSGALFDVHIGALIGPNAERIPVAVKLAKVTTFHNHPRVDGKDAEDYALRRIFNESKLLARPLLALQGTAVPRFYGMYTARIPLPKIPEIKEDLYIEVQVTVLEYIGRMACDEDDRHAWKRLSPAYKLAARDVLAQVHAAGVVHRDLTPRHIQCRYPLELIPPVFAPGRFAIGEPDSLCLLDFDCATRDKSENGAARGHEMASFEEELQFNLTKPE